MKTLQLSLTVVSLSSLITQKEKEKKLAHYLTLTSYVEISYLKGLELSVQHKNTVFSVEANCVSNRTQKKPTKPHTYSSFLY